MQLEIFSYKDGKGWSVSEFPRMDSGTTAVFVFGASSFIANPHRIEELLIAYPLAHIIGCSSAGEIFNTNVFDESLSVAVCQFGRTRLATASASVEKAEDSLGAGKKIASVLNHPDLKAVFVLSDGLNVNGTDLVKGINSVVAKGVVVTGGLAGDGKRFQTTWALTRETGIKSKTVCAIGFYGSKVQVDHGSKGGWDLFGAERLVTRSKGNVLFELDRKPALSVYKEYLGERAAGLPATGLLFPLALRSKNTDEKRLVRTILAVDELTQSLTFAGEIPEGSLVQLMRANFDRLVEGASDAAKMIQPNAQSVEPVLALAVSCVGRRIVLGERTEEEIEATLDVLPKNTKQVGFYSYGELSPYVAGQSCDLHNQTMTLTTLTEKP